MSYYDSPYWDRKIGVCTKHMLPSVPCPACMAEPIDEDVELILTESDYLLMDWEFDEPERSK